MFDYLSKETGVTTEKKEEYHGRSGMKIIHVPRGPLAKITSLARSIKLVKIFRALWRFAVNYDG